VERARESLRWCVFLAARDADIRVARKDRNEYVETESAGK
jgi:hypothetical protein